MRKNSAKALIKAGKPALGVMLNFPSPAVIEVCGYAGLDFVVIDAEHGPMDPETTESMVRAAEVSGITPLARIGQNVQQYILRYLDAGVMGVQMPWVNTRADAEAVIRSVKYVPVGKRGLAGVRVAQYGLTTPLPQYMQEANQETMIITQVETVEAVQNLPQVLELEPIDVFFIGPTDLSVSMGYPGRPTEPVVQAAIDSVIRQSLAAGKAVGTIARDGEHAKQLIDKGVTYLAGTVVTLLGNSLKQFRAAVPK